MNKKIIMGILFVLVLCTLNFSAAKDIDNSTADDSVLASSDSEVLEISENSQALSASKVNTHLEVKSNTTFDVIGDYFKVKLSDANNKALAKTEVTFTVNGKTYTQNTDSSGIASLQLRLNDGSYNIVTKFAGNSNYKASSLTTTIKIDNTREVDSGLSNSEIQRIIDNAKENNVILFKGKSYSDINLVITKSLTLISNVDTTLKSSSSSPVITIKGSKASLTTVKGFKIQGSGDGIKVDGSDYVKIISNDISCNGNGIVSLDTKYLNVTKNNIVKNSKSGISIAESSYSYIFNNKITNNVKNGIEVAKSSNVYIHGNTITNNDNGICLDSKVNGKNYGEGPNNVHINKNTISKNGDDGILVQNAGDNLNIKSNSIEQNGLNGISLAHVGNNVIKSNVIINNKDNGIKFFDMYVMPRSQDISYNAIFGNYHMEVEAKDTFYQDGFKLSLGDNWFTDRAGICPKIDAKKIQFTVKQIGPNKYQALFTDSNGNIASLLPDRTLTYTTNDGQEVSITIQGGAGVFTVDAKDGDNVRATVDNSDRDNTHDLNTKKSQEINGKSPEYAYPEIPQYELYEDIGSGNGQGTGNGQGSGNAQRGTGDNVGNSTHSQNMDPASGVNNQPNQVSQAQSAQTTSQASASDVGESGRASSDSQSVVKQIIIDEDEFFKITGISFIILLMILTIGFYYRDDIREMKSKM